MWAEAVLTEASVAAFKIIAEAGVPTDTYSKRPWRSVVFVMLATGRNRRASSPGIR